MRWLPAILVPVTRNIPVVHPGIIWRHLHQVRRIMAPQRLGTHVVHVRIMVIIIRVPVEHLGRLNRLLRLHTI